MMTASQYTFTKEKTNYKVKKQDRTALLQSIGRVFAVLPLSSLAISLNTFPNTFEIEIPNKATYQNEWRRMTGEYYRVAVESSRLERRLKKITAECKEDEDFLPIGEKAVANFLAVLDKCPDHFLKNWTLFPNDNGTLSFERNTGDSVSVINIGYEEISYSVENGPVIHIIGKDYFSPENVIDLLKKVA